MRDKREDKQRGRGKNARIGGVLCLMSIIITVILPAVVFAEETTPAAGNQLLKTYYSEPLGVDGEVAVYHFRACAKVPAVAPLRCTEDNKGISKSQCVGKDDKLNAGTIIKGCVKDSPKKVDNIAGTTYKALTQGHIDKFDEPGKPDEKCSPGDTEIVYAPKWAITDSNTAGIDRTPVLGTIVWGGSSILKIDDKTAPSELNEIAGKVVQNVSNMVILPMFENTLCKEWDKVINGDNSLKNNYDDIITSIDDKEPGAKNLKTSGDIAGKLLGKGCNNSNTTDDFGEDMRSTPLLKNPTVSCTAQYRIEGKNGIDIFTQYVGFIYRWAASIVGIISVLVIVVSGVQISMAQGETTFLDSAKTRIMQSIVGLAILFLASLILYTINPGFFIG